MKKVLILSDSLSGTGHQKRAEVLSHGLLNRNYQVTYFSNQLHNSALLNHKAFNFLEMPSYSNADDNENSFIAVKFDRLRKLYKSEQTTDFFDAVFFEHFPLGKYYLLEEMKMIHRLFKKAGTDFVCVYRDIIDNLDMEDISTGIDILNEYFSALIVLSDEKYMPLPDHFTSKVNIPITYLGYLDKRPRDTILVFGGGGKFNFDFYHLTLDVMSRIPGLDKYNVEFYTGKLMEEENFEQLNNEAPEFINIYRYSENLHQKQRNSVLTISTLGYNTFLDLLPLNNFNVVVPLTRNDEQLLRARFFERVKPNVSVIEINNHYAQNLKNTLNHIMDMTINMNGLSNFINFVDRCCARELSTCS